MPAGRLGKCRKPSADDAGPPLREEPQDPEELLHRLRPLLKVTSSYQRGHLEAWGDLMSLPLIKIVR